MINGHKFFSGNMGFLIMLMAQAKPVHLQGISGYTVPPQDF